MVVFFSRAMQRFAVEQGSLAPALALEVLAAAHRHPAMPAAWQPHALAFDRRREAFATAFAASLEHGVAAATRSPDAAEPAPAQRRVLALQDEAEVDTGIALSGTADLIAAEAEAELRELQTYTSALAGCTHVNPRSNPFRPLAYAQALWDAIGAVCGNVPERGLLLKALSPGLARSLRPHWMSACTRLDNQGVTPSLYRTVVLAGPVQPAEPVAEPIAGPAPAQVPSLPPAPPAVARPSAAFEAALSDASLPAEFRLMLARLFGATARLSVADAACWTTITQWGRCSSASSPWPGWRAGAWPRPTATRSSSANA